MTDEQLMLLYQQGDQSAFAQLYSRYHARVLGYLKKRCSNESAAEDLFQKIFMKFHRLRHKYDNRYPVSAWIFTIARSSWIDFLRTNSKQTQIFSSEEIEGLSHTLLEESNSGETDFLLESLNQNEKDLIQTRFIDESSYQDMAEQLGLSEVTVRQRVSRVLKKLKDRYRTGDHHEFKK